MRYFLVVLCLTFAVSAAAADNKPDQSWTKHKSSGTNIAQETQPNDAQTPNRDRNRWVQEYQYGKNDVPKTGKPEEKGEFEVAPRK